MKSIHKPTKITGVRVHITQMHDLCASFTGEPGGPFSPCFPSGPLLPWEPLVPGLPSVPSCPCIDRVKGVIDVQCST